MPRTLDSDCFAAARGFLLTEARPLEAALYRFHFEGGAREEVLEALAPYQNADGGFGHGLEPDLRAPDSSAICTSVAFQVLRAVDSLNDVPVADRGIAYLLGTLDAELASWRIVPPEVEAHPHAPWWNQTGREHGYDAYSPSPTGELLGVLLHRRTGVPAPVIERITNRLFSHLEAAEELEMHDLLCVLRLHAARVLPLAEQARLEGRLRPFVEQAVVRDARQWGDYGLRPLQVAEEPHSPFGAGLEEAIERNLDFEIDEQQADGSWMPTWSWGDAYPDVWPRAQREWAGVLTLRRLSILARYGRLVG